MNTPFSDRTEAFLDAVATRARLEAEKTAHHERVIREAVARLRRAVDAAPRGKKSRAPAPEEASRSVADLYFDTSAWARKILGIAACAAAEADLLAPHEEEQARFSTAIKAKKEEIASLALHAVFPIAPDRITVYAPSWGAYGSQGLGEETYLEADCAIRVAILRARGFDARAKCAARPFARAARDWWVEADAPPAILHALRHWRLDDVRLLAVTHPANLKVLFGGMFPYAGAWDWPASAREHREHASFAAHRANEDAHVAQNGRVE